MNGEDSKVRVSIERPVAIVVEGLDYFHLLLSQVDDCPEFEDIQLFDFTQVPLGRWLAQFVGLSGIDRVRAVGVIRDAENNASGMARSVEDALRSNALPAPSCPMDVEIAGSRAAGYLIMPHGRPAGCLEHACLEAVTPDMPMGCATDFVTCVDTPSRNDNWRAKVKVHCLIAASRNPAMTLGQSAKANLWDFRRPALSVMLEFIRKVRDASVP